VPRRRRVKCEFHRSTPTQQVTAYLQRFGALDGEPYFLPQLTSSRNQLRVCFATYVQATHARDAKKNAANPYSITFDEAIIWDLQRGEQYLYGEELKQLCQQLEEGFKCTIEEKRNRIKITHLNSTYCPVVLKYLGDFFGDTFVMVEDGCAPRHQYLRELEQKYRTKIIRNDARLGILGLASARTLCEAALREYLGEIREDIVEQEVRLQRGDAREITGMCTFPLLVKKKVLTIGWFLPGFGGHTLDNLRYRTGASIELDHAEQLVRIRGTKRQVRKARRKIQRMCCGPPEQQSPEEDERPCCIECKGYSNVIASLCNHRFCIPCAKRHLACWLEASIPSEFPVCCLGCPEPLLWQDVEKILKEEKERTILLCRASKQYLHTDQDELYLPCSKPACFGVHNRKKAFSSCSVCENFRCRKCTRPAELHERLSECPFVSGLL